MKCTDALCASRTVWLGRPCLWTSSLVGFVSPTGRSGRTPNCGPSSVNGVVQCCLDGDMLFHRVLSHGLFLSWSALAEAIQDWWRRVRLKGPLGVAPKFLMGLMPNQITHIPEEGVVYRVLIAPAHVIAIPGTGHIYCSCISLYFIIAMTEDWSRWVVAFFPGWQGLLIFLVTGCTHIGPVEGGACILFYSFALVPLNAEVARQQVTLFHESIFRKVCSSSYVHAYFSGWIVEPTLGLRELIEQGLQ